MIIIIFNINENINNNDSDGNNIKFYKDNIFYKTSYKNKDEIINEIIISDFLECTNLDYVKYRKEIHSIEFSDGNILNFDFAVSKNFLNKGEMFITLNHLIKNLGLDSDEILYRSNYENKISNIINIINTNYNINIDEYLSEILLFDAIIQNYDRHLRNLSLIEYNNIFYYSPIFDNGLSLTNNKKYSKPFYISHEEQVYYSQKIFKCTININNYMLNKFYKKYSNNYKIDIIANNINKYEKYINIV